MDHPWWPAVDHSRTVLDHYASAEECEQAERECFARDAPLYNTRTPRYRGSPAPRSREPAEHDWRDVMAARRAIWQQTGEWTGQRVTVHVPSPDDIIDPDDYATDEYRATWLDPQHIEALRMDAERDAIRTHRTAFHERLRIMPTSWRAPAL